MSFVSNLVGFTRKSILPKVGKSDTYNMYVESKDAGEHAFTAILRPMPGYRLESDTVEGQPQGTYRVSRGSQDGKPAVYGQIKLRIMLRNSFKAFFASAVYNAFFVLKNEMAASDDDTLPVYI